LKQRLVESNESTACATALAEQQASWRNSNKPKARKETATSQLRKQSSH
jgi:hypothetical protein